MNPKEHTRQVRDTVVEKFKAWLGYEKNIPSFERLTEHCSVHLKMERVSAFTCTAHTVTVGLQT